MTNNREMNDIEVVEFYNDRGESERLFDEMNNDFLCKNMSFSFLQENTVFLIMMAICRNLFHFLTGFISKRVVIAIIALLRGMVKKNAQAHVAREKPLVTVCR